jgi:hypothetical protein
MRRVLTVLAAAPFFAGGLVIVLSAIVRLSRHPAAVVLDITLGYLLLGIGVAAMVILVLWLKMFFEDSGW